jgi:Ulp1 family protease
MDKIKRKIYLDKIIKFMKNDFPLFKNMEDYGFYYVHYYVYDENNNRIYYETSRGKWVRKEYDKNGRKISYFCCRKKIRI